MATSGYFERRGDDVDALVGLHLDGNESGMFRPRAAVRMICKELGVDWPEPAAELAGVRRSADEFQALAEKLERQRDAANEESRRLRDELAAAETEAEELQARDRVFDAQIDRLRGEATDLRRRLQITERNALELGDARLADARVVEAAVAMGRVWHSKQLPTPDCHETVSALLAAVEAHPAYAEPEPVKIVAACSACGEEFDPAGWAGTLCRKCQTAADAARLCKNCGKDRGAFVAPFCKTCWETYDKLAEMRRRAEEANT